MNDANLLELFDRAVDSSDLSTIKECLSKDLALISQSPSLMKCTNTFPSVLFKRIVNKRVDDKNWIPSNLHVLLNSGFDKHIQSVLMYTITYGNTACLKLLLKYGANFYSILRDLHYYVSFEKNLILTHLTYNTFHVEAYLIELDENEDIIEGRIKATCIVCNGSGPLCKHLKMISQCEDCQGNSICEHSRVKSKCKDCT